MILTCREDLDAPIEPVFARLTDTTAHERAILRHGGRIERVQKNGAFVPGASWRIFFPYRGKERKAKVELTEIERNSSIDATTKAGGMLIYSTLELIPIARGRTRMSLKVKLKPTTLSARLVVQSMKLTRGSIERRMRGRFYDFAADLASRAAG